MAEQATVFIGTQIGVEATPGTSVPATKRLLGMSFEPTIKPKIKAFRARGQKYNTIAVPGKEYTEIKIAGDMCYNDLAYVFSSGLAYAAPVQVNPPSGLAYQWTHTPLQTDVDPIKTFTVESGSSVRAGKWTYGLVNEWGYKLTRDEFALSAMMVGQLFTDGVTLTATPTDVALQPIAPGTVNVYLDSTSTNLGVTQLLRAFEVDFKLSGIYGEVWPINASVSSFVAHVDHVPKAELKLLVEADSQGMALLTTMRNGTKQFCRIKATGANIDASPATPYSFTHDLCVEVTNVSAFKDDGGVYAIEWTFEVSNDDTWGKSHTVQLVNTLSAL